MTSDIISRPTLDVSELPKSAMDSQSVIWWGNLMLILIETVMFGLLVATYFYVRLRFDEWPPPSANEFPLLSDTRPDLLIPTINLAVLATAILPTIFMDRAAHQRSERKVLIGLGILIVMGVAAGILRWSEFDAVHFKWNENAYGSVTWTIMGMHLLHLSVVVMESALMATWVMFKGLDDQHARDVQTVADYWFWVSGIWIPLWVILFAGPYFF